MMSKLKTRYRITFWCVIFIGYAFFAARPVQKEVVLDLKWINSLETSYPAAGINEDLRPFKLGERFGYITNSGKFSIKLEKTGQLALSPKFWAEFSGVERSINIKNPEGKTVLTLTSPQGYPFFLGDKIFIMHRSQSSVSHIDEAGNEIWRHDFASIITCVDAGDDFFLAGMLDGSVDLLGKDGKILFSQETSGSRLSAVYGCALDPSGQKVAVISGLDDQRFMFIEETGGVWRITYHEFLGDGFNRPVHIRFVDGGKKVVFERESGIGIYDILTRNSNMIEFDGTLRALDADGGGGLLFFIAEESKGEYKLIAASQNRVFIAAPFKSKSSFLDRRGGELVIGGGSVLAAFSITER